MPVATFQVPCRQPALLHASFFFSLIANGRWEKGQPLAMDTPVLCTVALKEPHMLNEKVGLIPSKNLKDCVSLLSSKPPK